MKRPLVSDELWKAIEPLLPEHTPSPRGGRPRADERACLGGIIFVLRSGIPWEMLPQEMGCGCGMTCWNRLHEWQEAGVWEKLHSVLLNKLGEAARIDWDRASIDASSVPAPAGGKDTGPNPTDRGKQGTKRHIVVDKQGVPLAVKSTAANVNEGTQLTDTIEKIPPIHGPRGRPRRHPRKLDADKGYDSASNRRELRKRGIVPRIARRGIESPERLGRYRWVIERTISWFNRFRRLRVRYERRADIYAAFLMLAAALITGNFLSPYH